MEGEATKESVVCGHHIHKEVCRPVIGQDLPVLSEPNSCHDGWAVAIYMDGEVESSELTETHSWWAHWGRQMAMANDSTSAIGLMKLAVEKHIENVVNGNDECHFYEKQCHVWWFYSPFHISSALLDWLFAKWSSFTLPSRACSNSCPLVEYFALPTPKFHLIRAVCFVSRI